MINDHPRQASRLMAEGERETSFNLRLNGPRPSKVEASCRILRKLRARSKFDRNVYVRR